MSFFRTPQAFKRRAPGEYVDGRYVDGAESDLTVLATIQPATLSDYDMLRAEPAGRRIERVVRIYTADRLQVAGEGVNGDILVWDGSRYEVIAVSPWRTLIPHFRYWASLVLTPDQTAEGA